MMNKETETSNINEWNLHNQTQRNRAKNQQLNLPFEYPKIFILRVIYGNRGKYLFNTLQKAATEETTTHTNIWSNSSKLFGGCQLQEHSNTKTTGEVRQH